MRELAKQGWPGRTASRRYTATPHHDDGRPFITNAQHTAEKEAATRFRRGRRAPLIPSHGLPMPYAFTAPSPEPRVVTFSGLLAARG